MPGIQWAQSVHMTHFDFDFDEDSKTHIAYIIVAKAFVLY